MSKAQRIVYDGGEHNDRCRALFPISLLCLLWLSGRSAHCYLAKSLQDKFSIEPPPSSN